MQKTLINAHFLENLKRPFNCLDNIIKKDRQILIEIFDFLKNLLANVIDLASVAFPVAVGHLSNLKGLLNRIDKNCVAESLWVVIQVGKHADGAEQDRLGHLLKPLRAQLLRLLELILHKKGLEDLEVGSGHCVELNRLEDQGLRP